MKATPLLIAWHNDNAPIYSVHFDPHGKGRLATAGKYVGDSPHAAASGACANALDLVVITMSEYDSPFPNPVR